MAGTKRIAMALVASALVVGACGSSTATTAPASGAPAASGDAGGTASSGLTFAIITHSDGTDNFWPVLQNGAIAAGKSLGVKILYTYSGDVLKQSQLIDDAIAQKVNGIATSLPNADAMKEALGRATAAGIPFITMNSGQNESAAIGAIAHVGQNEFVAGQGAGKRLKDAGLKHALCVVHEAGNVGLAERCNGFKDTFGGTVDELQVKASNLPDVSATVSAKLQADKTIDAVLTLNPAVGTAALQGIKDAGSSAKLATFDLSPDVIKSVIAGEILFAIDQQQYLQGYLPVQMLYLYNTNLNTVGGGQPVLTGPGFVTKDNAAAVQALTAKGTR
jgi:simple sugar transport system substrate-binding protein